MKKKQGWGVFSIPSLDVNLPSSCSDAKIIHVPKIGLVISAQFDYWSQLHGSQWDKEIMLGFRMEMK